jgi:hypothetical protein
MFYSPDYGQTWSIANSPFNLTPVTYLAADEGAALAVGYSGLALSTDHGRRWQNVTANLDIPGCRGIEVLNGTVFAGTVAGVWRRQLSEMIGTTGAAPCPEPPASAPGRVKAALDAKSRVTVFFHLSRAERVSVKVYDLRGHEIASLVSGTLSPGPHRINWNARNFPAGCYIARIRTGHIVTQSNLPIFR